jgi:hypothetical protein
MGKFAGKRYLTRGIHEHLDITLQIILWQMIERLEIEVDYLQVFEIEQLPNSMLKIIHKQEVPEYRSTVIFPGEIQSRKLKIFVIDDHEYSTMLLAEEY